MTEPSYSGFNGYTGMRRLPCFLCDWNIIYDYNIPGLREACLEKGLRHYTEVHAGPRGVERILGV